MKDLLLLGASGLAREAAAAAQAGHRIIGVLDDDPALRGTRVAGVEVLGGMAHAAEYDADLLVCVGSGAGRRSVVARLDALGVDAGRYATLVDDSVRIPDDCTVGAGSILLAGVVLTAAVTIGRHVVVMPNSTLTHDVRLDDFATLTSGVSLAGSVHVGEAAYLGMNAAVRQGLTVGAGAVIGMGAAVLADVPDGETWVGVPARSLRVSRPEGRA
ncbi:NeuD/PglB/VioB family sugar acetyltransferase [Leifsonia aquatica]|uniref:NeuD/PglB/VioB family sugar acetyltransferase n=1 Tax=Leifsonia aquatica TaxID=144185 RepID=UPI00046A990B|nr:NeuD/PglB/VioB family sugar acetyltransferase [Leifsonia aquatica]